LAVAAIRILPAISNISGSVNALVFNRPAFESAYDKIVKTGLRSKHIDKKKNRDVLNKVELQETVVINNIRWKYSDDQPDILSDLNLQIKKGESIGIIGESGAGKTTLADVILGILEPQSGKVEADGRSIYEEDTAWWKMIGYVPQNVFLLDDTIKNNILFGIAEEELDEERLDSAIDKAQLRNFVESQKDGVETVLGERGVRISGGQRQRIAIARALYYDPDVLVLDEATSALDNETENAVIDAINALQGEKTLIIIAHRLSTIEKCDKIVRIENGKAISVMQ
jgi:ABC-type bacteriocin/lantibiotic exporter with double-glycine peptidase domain